MKPHSRRIWYREAKANRRVIENQRDHQVFYSLIAGVTLEEFVKELFSRQVITSLVSEVLGRCAQAVICEFRVVICQLLSVDLVSRIRCRAIIWQNWLVLRSEDELLINPKSQIARDTSRGKLKRIMKVWSEIHVRILARWKPPCFFRPASHEITCPRFRRPRSNMAALTRK